MEFQKYLYFLLVLFSVLCHSQARQFYVGGKDGWVLNPSEDYNQWSGRNRFLINDTLFFKYNRGSDSVLEVNKDDYDKCNTKNPIKKFEDGDSVFTLDRSGPFYFVSGNDGNCEKGQKFVVVLQLKQSHPPEPLHLMKPCQPVPAVPAYPFPHLPLPPGLPLHLMEPCLPVPPAVPASSYPHLPPPGTLGPPLEIGPLLPGTLSPPSVPGTPSQPSGRTSTTQIPLASFILSILILLFHLIIIA